MGNRKHRGFTLIELMIGVSIVAILVSVAYPSYIQYAQRARRADATVALMRTAQQMERCLTVNNSYTLAAGCTVPNNNPSPDVHYNVAVTGRTGTAYVLTATPVAGGAQAGDSHCTSYGMNQLSQRCANGLCEPAGGAAAEITKCWR
ncbi:MAG: type IV pilin protein [Nevskiales bacterium]